MESPAIEYIEDLERLRLASGEAKFQCKDCEGMFNSYEALWYHTKSKHEGVKCACNLVPWVARRPMAGLLSLLLLVPWLASQSVVIQLPSVSCFVGEGQSKS